MTIVPGFKRLPDLVAFRFQVFSDPRPVRFPVGGRSSGQRPQFLITLPAYRPIDELDEEKRIFVDFPMARGAERPAVFEDMTHGVIPTRNDMVRVEVLIRCARNADLAEADDFRPKAIRSSFRAFRSRDAHRIFPR